MEFELYCIIGWRLGLFRSAMCVAGLICLDTVFLFCMKKKKKSILFTILFYSDVPILAFCFVPSSFIASG